MNAKIVIISAITFIVGIALGASLGQEQSAEMTPQSTETESVERGDTVAGGAGARSDTYTYEGEGTQMLGPISLREGLTIIRAKNLTGPNDTFSFEVLKDENENGAIDSGEGYTGVYRSVAYAAAESYNGEIAFKADKADYFIKVDGGRWEIVIAQPEKQTESADAPTTFEGSGDTVTDAFFLEEGLITFRATHSGNGNFSIALMDQNGNSTRYLVNELGPVETDAEYENVFSDNYVFVVSASGPWTIEMK